MLAAIIPTLVTPTQAQDQSSSIVNIGRVAGGGNGPSFNRPSDVASDSNDNIYVSDSGNNRIQKFDSNGTYLTQWGSSGSGNGQFNAPRGITTDSNDNIYVSDTGNHRIQKFDSNGTYLSQWGSFGSGNGQFRFPRGVTTDSNNNIYVADSGNNRIQKFDSSGTYLTQYTQAADLISGQLFSPNGIQPTINGRLYAIDTGSYSLELLCDKAVADDNCGEGTPNNGDANNDGIPDWQQPHVRTITSPASNTPVTLEVSPECSITDLSIQAESSNITQDQDFNYPAGLMDFTIDCQDPGFTADITQYYHNLTGDEYTVRKHNPDTNEYFTIDGSLITNQTIDNTPVVVANYSVTDGGLLDLTNQANGTIRDPAGLAQYTGEGTTGELAETGISSTVTATLATLLVITGLAGLSRRLSLAS